MRGNVKDDSRKIAAIWWRVSTDDQREISPDTQIQQSLALAKQEGYEVPPENIIGTDWHSLSVWDSPAMARIRALIHEKAISAIFLYEPDRGPSKPAHRLLFRASCEENGIQVRCCHGQIPDGDMGEVMELLSAWAKEKQVHRAQQGSRDGLRDRAKIKGLPVNGHAPYGFQMRYNLQDGKKVPVAFEANPQAYPIASQVWQMTLEGATIRGICRHLVDQGIPAPKGGTAWNTPTVLRMLKNPLYAGRYYALRTEAKEPERRKGDSYGKSSERRRAPEEWVLLDGFPVESPIVNWEQFEAVQKRLRLNKQHSRRNSNRLYLLTGMLFCGEDNWRLQIDGRRNRPSHAYICPKSQRKSVGVPACTNPQLHGVTVDNLVWEQVSRFLSDPHTFMAEIERQREGHNSGEVHARQRVEELTAKLRTVDRMETELVGLKLRYSVSDVAFERQGALLRAERLYYQDDIERQRATLNTLQQSADALDTFAQLRETITDRLAVATTADRRWVLEALNTRVATHHDKMEISIGVPSYLLVIGNTMRSYDDYVPATEVA